MFWLILMGWLASAIVSIWMIYRIIKGALYLNDDKAIIF
ncbi:MAG: putative membrane protein [Oceanospirillaceae bacterium]